MYHYAGNNPVRYIDPDGNSATGAVLGWIGTDLAIPEPTDVIPWKWVGYGALITGAAIIDCFAVKTVTEIAEKSKDDSEAKPSNEQSPLPDEGVKSNKTKPENKTPEGAGRKGALREAKRKNRVPTSQPPESQTPNYDKRGRLQPGRQYRYRDSEGKPVDIRDDSKGHEYPDDPNQNRGPHFNDKAGNHYDY